MTTPVKPRPPVATGHAPGTAQQSTSSASAPGSSAPPGAPATGTGSEPATCGKPVQTGTVANGQKVSKPCIKVPGHDGHCSWRQYTRADTASVTTDMLSTLEDVPSDTQGDFAELDTAPRSATQQTIDAHVKDAHAKWAAIAEDKRPKTFDAAVKAGVAKRYTVAPENEAAFRSMLRNAARLHGIAVKIAPKLRKHVDGSTMLYWFAHDTRKRSDAN